MSPTDIPGFVPEVEKHPDVAYLLPRALKALGLLRDHCNNDLFLMSRSGVRSTVPYAISDKRAVKGAARILKGA